jgi:hypothetical protein
MPCSPLPRGRPRSRRPPPWGSPKLPERVTPSVGEDAASRLLGCSTTEAAIPVATHKFSGGRPGSDRTSRELAQSGVAHVTLIDAHNYRTFPPMLSYVATATTAGLETMASVTRTNIQEVRHCANR